MSHIVQHCALGAILAALLVVVPCRAVSAQRAGMPAGISIRPHALSLADSARKAQAAAGGGESRASRVAKHAGVGALVGAAFGGIAALIVTHDAGVTDHSEDGIAYMVLMPLGAAAGALLGIIVGLGRSG